MLNQESIQNVSTAFADLLGKLSAAKFIGVFLVALAVAYLVNLLVDAIMRRVAKQVAAQTDRSSKNERMLQLRRAETFVSVASTAIKAAIIFAAFYVAFKVVYTGEGGAGGTPVTLIGASAFFVVLAGATIQPLLRDVTTGTIMIIEQWFNVGDHIKVEPFGDVTGVVEQVSLRSTKIRSLNGEVIWLHNQHMQAVRVTPRGVRTIALEVFVTDLETGREIIERTIKTLPKGPTMMARPLAIVETEELGDGLWRIMATGQTAPGREWLIEDFAIATMKKYDELDGGEQTIAFGPVAHYADATAERRFKRAIRAKN